ncbi:MAG: hypothetical protein JWL88_551 [Parcubacteria group bacterium]|nr:hypothetical protein [Parcubacteria group bacterium]
MNFLGFRHTEAGQKVLAAFLAIRYVRKGSYWLNRHAPRGWYRNCMNGGYSRINVDYGNEGILAIAFEYEAKFADTSGYINEGKVLQHFGIFSFSKRCYRMGFETPMGTYIPFKKKYPEIKITSEMLNAAWANLLKDPPAEWRIPYRHRTALDQKFAALDFSFAEPKPKLSIWRKICRIGSHAKASA